jgi:hypothetical protein
MFTQVIAQRLGWDWDLILGLSVLEGICLTVVLMLLVERNHFFRFRLGAPRAPRRATSPNIAVKGARDPGLPPLRSRTPIAAAPCDLPAGERHCGGVG